MLFNCDDKNSEDISLADVLLHFQKMPDLEKFGILGFYRLNGFNQSKRAYKRSHVTSTVILNLKKLKNVDYFKKAFVWEDLQFNRDAEDVARERGGGQLDGGGSGEAAVICKCYRFAFSTPQLREGGCHDMVANKIVLSAPSAEDTPAEETSDTSLQKMMTCLGLADKYVKMLETADMDFDTLKTFLDDFGLDKLLHELKEAGVDKPGVRMKIASYLKAKRS